MNSFAGTSQNYTYTHGKLAIACIFSFFCICLLPVQCIQLSRNDKKFIRAPQLMFDSGGTFRISFRIIIIFIIVIVIVIIYYNKSIVVSCSRWFCESGQQPVVKGLTESCTVILTIMLFFIIIFIIFFSIQVPVSKSLLSPVKLFFVHVLLSSQSQLLQYTSQSQLILHLMHLQLLGLQSLLSCPTFLQSHL